MDAEDTASSTELVVDSTKVDLLDAELAKKGSAHDARFDGNVEGAFGDNGAVDAGSGVQLLAIGEEVAITGVDIAPNARIVVVALVLRVLRLKISVTGVRQQGANGHEFGVPSAVAADVGCVHAPGNHPVLVNKNTTDGRLVGLEGESGLYHNSLATERFTDVTAVKHHGSQAPRKLTISKASLINPACIALSAASSGVSSSASI